MTPHIQKVLWALVHPSCSLCLSSRVPTFQKTASAAMDSPVFSSIASKSKSIVYTFFAWPFQPAYFHFCSVYSIVWIYIIYWWTSDSFFLNWKIGGEVNSYGPFTHKLSYEDMFSFLLNFIFLILNRKLI